MCSGPVTPRPYFFMPHVGVIICGKKGRLRREVDEATDSASAWVFSFEPPAVAEPPPRRCLCLRAALARAASSPAPAQALPLRPVPIRNNTPLSTAAPRPAASTCSAAPRLELDNHFLPRWHAPRSPSPWLHRIAHRRGASKPPLVPKRPCREPPATTSTSPRHGGSLRGFKSPPP